MGLRQDEPDARAYGLEELLEQDPEFQVHDWQGWGPLLIEQRLRLTARLSAPQPVIDRDGTVLLVLGGFPPNASDWGDVARAAAEAMDAAAEEIYTEPKWRRKSAANASKVPRRGPHAAEHVGPAMGGGQRYPMNLQHSVVNLAIFARLFALKSFERIAGWTNTLFMAFAPLLHQYYSSTLDQLFDWDATQERVKPLRRNFMRRLSVFATATFNFGPATVTFPHIDFGNLAWGWCAITALGSFDPDRGGHLILWDLKLVIRFPPGCTILLPSAILRHSNVKIQENERRYSFTQFTPAGIFRWVYNGFRTENDVNTARSTTADEHEQRRQDRTRRWAEGVKMYRTWPTDSVVA
ncbi:hypothetical protein B0H15DRAFT_791809 [Mycena belliarum]|uniref:Uncharacterized protein n=1 Tax=Mycena belliarum TaxID=1033014 RepID=A0AAD6XMF2_9AGAR|nr:hypothetical protein B0H15DRAFT_791809 [Mycena belliae]